MIDNIFIILIILSLMLLFLFIILLISEIQIDIKLKADKGFSLDIKVKWLFFKIYHQEISNIDGFKNSGNSEDVRDHDVFEKILFLIKNNIHELSKLLIIIIESIKLEKLNGNLIFGFHSPVTTALSFAAINNIFTIANTHNKSNLSVGADFSKEILYFDGGIAFRIRLLKPTFRFLSFITSNSGFKLISQLRKLRQDL
ncbi:MAG: hypothetical protein LBD03_02235 [Methanobrevibacter sp.]|nr:hypothetical protein [Candidatus Methanovirga procula]